MAEFMETLSRFDESIRRKHVLDEEQKRLLQESLKNFKRKTVDDVKPRVLSAEEVNTESGSATKLFQGDIILSKEQQNQILSDIRENRFKRQAYVNENSTGKWELLEVPYQLNKTLIGLITVNTGDKCASSVGRQPWGLQFITLGRKCETIGTAAHELAHALGFWHAHARHDRDKFITVNFDNINRTFENEFMMQSNKSNKNYDLPYDFGSVMQYRATAASFNGKPTVVPKDGLYTQTLGSLTISFYDLLMMNTHYNCTGKCEEEESAECQNGGFPRPRNCSECICPSGYGGRLCDERPQGCGRELNATTNWTLLTSDEASSMTAGSQDGYKRCVYWLMAPNGSHVEVKLKKLPENVSVDGCIYAGVEIKIYEDQRLTGYRFCSKGDVNTTLVSNSSTLPVMTYMRRRRNDTAMELEFRIAGERGKGDPKKKEEGEKKRSQSSYPSLLKNYALFAKQFGRFREEIRCRKSTV